MDELTPQELNKFLSEFLITVRKKEDNDRAIASMRQTEALASVIVDKFTNS